MLKLLQSTETQSQLNPDITQWTLVISTRERLSSETDKIKFILSTNGYAEHAINLFMAKNIKQFHSLPKFGTER